MSSIAQKEHLATSTAAFLRGVRPFNTLLLITSSSIDSQLLLDRVVGRHLQSVYSVILAFPFAA